LGVGPDNKLYVSVGAPCNICEPPAANAQIRRLNLDGSGAEPYALGGRPVGVQPMRYGSLLVSDDYAGAVYRISYGSSRTAYQ